MYVSKRYVYVRSKLCKYSVESFYFLFEKTKNVFYAHSIGVFDFNKYNYRQSNAASRPLVDIRIREIRHGSLVINYSQ